MKIQDYLNEILEINKSNTLTISNLINLKQMKKLTFLILLLFNVVINAQKVMIKGKVLYKYFNSQQQQQSNDYHGSGAWVIGPYSNMRICVYITNKKNNTITPFKIEASTDIDGFYEIKNIPALKGEYIELRYDCNDEKNYIRQYKVSNSKIINARKFIYKTPR